MGVTNSEVSCDAVVKRNSSPQVTHESGVSGRTTLDSVIIFIIPFKRMMMMMMMMLMMMMMVMRMIMNHTALSHPHAFLSTAATPSS